jgi:hypothetical protein
MPYEDDDPDADWASPPGWCPANQAKVPLIDMGTFQKLL